MVVALDSRSLRIQQPIVADLQSLPTTRLPPIIALRIARTLHCRFAGLPLPVFICNKLLVDDGTVAPPDFTPAAVQSLPLPALSGPEWIFGGQLFVDLDAPTGRFGRI